MAQRLAPLGIRVAIKKERLACCLTSACNWRGRARYGSRHAELGSLSTAQRLPRSACR
jgi:hypothetical protein